MLQQGDGSYTAFEMTDASPYRIVRTTRNFQKQLTSCPGLPVTGTPPEFQPPEVFTPLNSGGYLWVRRSDVTGPPGAYFSLYVTVFDAALKMTSEAQYPVLVVDALAVADVNGDGIPDILSATSFPHSAALQVLIGNGGSSFQSPVSYPIASSLSLRSLVLADLNGDRKLDAVVSGSRKLSIFLGNGDGTFQAERTLPADSNSPAVAIADLNGDGKPDLAFTAGLAVEVALGVGDGTFGALTSYPIGWGDSLAIADMNGDGSLDIVTSGFSILFGDGHGGFPKRADYWQEVTGGIILADFDGDGKPDIIVGSGTAGALTGPSITVLFGSGSGTFAGPPITLVSGVPSINAYDYSQVVTDFNGDGIPDLVVQEPGQLNVLTGIGDGTFRPTFHYVPASGSPSFIAAADFNHDGRPDVVVTITSATGARVEVLLGNGDGTFQAPLAVTSPCCLTALAVADFNGDGRPDVAVLLRSVDGVSSDRMLIYLGTGAGTFAAPLATLAGAYPSALAVGDFNRDGRLDVVVATQGDLNSTARAGSGFSILFGKGDGTFSAPVPIPVGIDHPFPVGLLAGDWNRDGLLDLAITLNNTSNGPLLVLLGRGDGNGTFQPPIAYPIAAYSITNQNQLAAADLNGDDVADLIVAGPNWLLGNGDGTFQPEVTFAGSAYPPLTPVIAADFNHDGRIDLAGGIFTAGVAVLLNISQPAPLTVVSAASFAVGPLAQDSLATAFGSGLAPNTAVTVAGTSATILYASAGQVNFLVPASLPAGPATVTITSSAGSVSERVTISAVAPTLFTLNAAGMAAAYVIRVRQGNQTMEPISDPIDLGPPGDQVYLVLFGTGIRSAAAGQVSVQIQGIDVPVVYAGPQSQFSGLDQVNVLLPRELTGTGDASVVLTAAGTDAPTVHISVK
jgi:uncharacterized protein (TIGR03437 family)